MTTTHCVSTVIRPDPLQFVKIQSTELSKKAVEQIRLAEEVKITKEKIKEVEEEWQNNLLNWKSKRRQSRLTGGEESDSGDNQQRKVKTFSEILNEKVKSGHRIGYNLHKYIGIQDDEEEESLVLANNNTNNNNHKQGTGSSRVSNSNNNLDDYHEDDESKQLKSYEHQQAELQKKRQELNNKLQELEQLEKKANELERQERVSSTTEVRSSTPQSPSSASSTQSTTKIAPSSNTLISPTVIVSIKNENEKSSINPSAGNCISRNSDEIRQNDNFREKKVFNLNSSTDLSRRDNHHHHQPQSSILSQSTNKTNETNRQKSVWNYLLQQQDDPRVVNHSHLSNQNVDPNQQQQHGNWPNSQIDSESEDDDHLNDSIDADEDAEKEQMLSFRAKLSTFESLSKCNPPPPPPTQQQQQNNHNNQQQQQQQQQHQQTITSKPIRKSEKVKKTADQLTSRLFPSAASSLSSSLSISSSSSSSSSVTTANHNNPSPASSLSSSSTATPTVTVIPTTETTTTATSINTSTTNPNMKEYENTVMMKSNRPPTAEDLAYKEEMKVFHQRLQNQNLVDQQKHLLYASQLPLQTNSFNTPQHHPHHQQQHASLHHYHSQPQLHTFQQPLQQTQPLPRQLLQQQSATQLQQFQQPPPPQPSHHQKQPSLIMLSSSQQQQQQPQQQQPQQQQPQQPQPSSPYNINHWVIQEAELRRLHYTQQSQPQPQPQQASPYNINHWVIQEAELRRLHHAQQQQSAGPALMARSTSINRFPQSSQVNLNSNTSGGNTYENHVYENSPFRGSHASGLNRIQSLPVGADTTTLIKKSNGLQGIQPPSMQPLGQTQTQVQQQQHLPLSQPQQSHQLQSQGPLQLAQPLQSQQLLQSQQQQQQQQLLQQQKQMLSVSGKKKCSNCGDELGRGCAAMVIETLSLYYHINCFRCSVCHIQLGNGTCGTDVRVRNHKLHCHNCYSNDEAGLKFSRV